MRIGIDARTILNPEKGNGIGEGHYAYQLLRHITQLDTKNEYVFFFDARIRQKDVHKFSKPNVRLRFYPFSDYKKYLPVAYSELLGRATLGRERLDVLHSASPSSRIPVGYSGRCMTTFHNMGMSEHSECYPYAKRVREVTIARYMAKKSDLVIASSQSVSRSIQKEFGIKGEKISVVYGGVDGRFFAPGVRLQQSVLRRLGVASPYILFLGTISPINNIVRTIEAFARFRDLYREKTGSDSPHRLVLAGKKRGSLGEYEAVIRRLGLSDRVVFPGYVEGDDLVPLFRSAEFFVLPSLYEGFGTTVLEAFACETPAIVSQVGSMPEVAGDGARFVDPTHTDDIARAMTEFSLDPAMRQAYVEKGSEQVKKFNWEKTARETIALYERLASSR